MLTVNIVVFARGEEVCEKVYYTVHMGVFFMILVWFLYQSHQILFLTWEKFHIQCIIAEKHEKLPSIENFNIHSSVFIYKLCEHQEKLKWKKVF